MAYQTWIADRCREYGLEVIEVSGWQTRGSSSFNPKGVVAHHTASRAGRDAPALGICINGRAGLSGPLANIVLARSGKVYIIAAGRANHAGTGGYRGLSGNSSVLGIEAENDGVGEPWGAAQLDAYYKVCAALLEGINANAEWVCGHKEWAPRRKIDPTGLDMNDFRWRVATAKKGESPKKDYTYTPEKSYTAAPEKNFRIWHKGAVVSNWQAHLNEYTGQKLDSDGYFGPSTHDATVNFQRFFGLTPDGIVGENTLRTMATVKVNIEAERKKSVDYSGMPLLQKGSVGAEVKVWQEALNKYASQGIIVDGDFGYNTYLATFNFQRFFGLRADGIVGPNTWGLMEYVANSQ